MKTGLHSPASAQGLIWPDLWGRIAILSANQRDEYHGGALNTLDGLKPNSVFFRELILILHLETRRSNRMPDHAAKPLMS